MISIGDKCFNKLQVKKGDKDKDKDKKVTPNLKLGGVDLGKVKTERILID